MPRGLAKPFNLKKIISPLLSDVMGGFHGIKLSLGKWTLLILSTNQSPFGDFSQFSWWLTLLQIKCFSVVTHFIFSLFIGNPLYWTVPFHITDFERRPYELSSNLQNALLCRRIRSDLSWNIPISNITNNSVSDWIYICQNPTDGPGTS